MKVLDSALIEIAVRRYLKGNVSDGSRITVRRPIVAYFDYTGVCETCNSLIYDVVRVVDDEFHCGLRYNDTERMIQNLMRLHAERRNALLGIWLARGIFPVSEADFDLTLFNRDEDKRCNVCKGLGIGIYEKDPPLPVTSPECREG